MEDILYCKKRKKTWLRLTIFMTNHLFSTHCLTASRYHPFCFQTSCFCKSNGFTAFPTPKIVQILWRWCILAGFTSFVLHLSSNNLIFTLRVGWLTITYARDEFHVWISCLCLRYDEFYDDHQKISVHNHKTFFYFRKRE